MTTFDKMDIIKYPMRLLSGGEKGFLVSLSFMTSDEPLDVSVKVTQKRLEHLTGLSRQSIIRITKTLESKGFIRIIKSSGKSNVYEVKTPAQLVKEGLAEVLRGGE